MTRLKMQAISFRASVGLMYEMGFWGSNSSTDKTHKKNEGQKYDSLRFSWICSFEIRSSSPGLRLAGYREILGSDPACPSSQKRVELRAGNFGRYRKSIAFLWTEIRGIFVLRVGKFAGHLLVERLPYLLKKFIDSHEENNEKNNQGHSHVGTKIRRTPFGCFLVVGTGSVVVGLN